MTTTQSSLVIASANPDKVKEIQAILGDVVLQPRPASIPDVDETGETLEDNARLKATAIAEATGCGAIADDTGLEVAALNGAPGVRSARYAGENVTYQQNVEKLLLALSDAPLEQRRARFRTIAMVVRPDGSEVTAEGIVDGTIATEPRGHRGFGYDPVFIPDEGDGRTFAEMSADEKHTLSHRGRAFRRLRELLADTA